MKRKELADKEEDEQGRSFPQTFIDFLTANGVSLDEYDSKPLPRFIRVNPRTAGKFGPAELSTELGTPVEPVTWLPGFYSLNGDVKIVNCKAYIQGDIYGMDISSGVAVHALDIQPNDHVLDLCCAPGGKMCLMGDLQGDSIDVVGTVTGVDISRQRIYTCKSLLRKYKMRRVRLFEADGTTFNVHAPSRVGRWTRKAQPEEEILDADTVLKQPSQSTPTAPIPNQNKTKKSRSEPPDSTVGTEDHDFEPLIPTLPTTSTSSAIPTPGPSKMKPLLVTQLLAGDLQVLSKELRYDKVLVDAECTHDGSIAHLKKCDRVGWEKFEAYFFDTEKMNGLERLQRGLISNGFRLLKPGGVLVYSTCSFSRRQNEDIVQWLLDNHTDAELESIPQSDRFPVAKPLPGLPADMQKTLRFTPAASGSSGMFVARIRKK
ncbi:hypothetical protein HDU76_002390 [Blyttiomyces sp. JEL0837]|nr:hypothetical protein HDU76_002390 [Blyttiomyces sp. JEL0837]